MLGSKKNTDVKWVEGLVPAVLAAAACREQPEETATGIAGLRGIVPLPAVQQKTRSPHN